jgi:hypothetical protein
MLDPIGFAHPRMGGKNTINGIAGVAFSGMTQRKERKMKDGNEVPLSEAERPRLKAPTDPGFYKDKYGAIWKKSTAPLPWQKLTANDGTILDDVSRYSLAENVAASYEFKTVTINEEPTSC